MPSPGVLSKRDADHGTNCQDCGDAALTVLRHNPRCILPCCCCPAHGHDLWANEATFETCECDGGGGDSVLLVDWTQLRKALVTGPRERELPPKMPRAAELVPGLDIPSEKGFAGLAGAVECSRRGNNIAHGLVAFGRDAGNLDVGWVEVGVLQLDCDNDIVLQERCKGRAVPIRGADGVEFELGIDGGWSRFSAKKGRRPEQCRTPPQPEQGRTPQPPTATPSPVPAPMRVLLSVPQPSSPPSSPQGSLASSCSDPSFAAELSDPNLAFPASTPSSLRICIPTKPSRTVVAAAVPEVVRGKSAQTPLRSEGPAVSWGVSSPNLPLFNDPGHPGEWICVL